MISIQITCPFRYQYNGKQKDIFFMSGEYYHLDPVKDKEEVKKILSPSFEFKQYIHVNKETLPEEFLKDSSLEEANSFHSYDDPEEREYVSTLIEGTISTEQIKDPGPDYEESATIDAEENKWEQEINSKKLTTKEKEEKEIELDNVIQTPDLAPEEKEVKEAQPAEDFKDGEVEKRREELDGMHYTKIQDVAEQYNIEYTKKDETIENIIKVEFKIHTDIKEIKSQLKTDEPLKD